MSFSEFLPYSGLEKADALDRFLTWGGMPLAVLAPDDAARASYLESLFGNKRGLVLICEVHFGGKRVNF